MIGLSIGVLVVCFMISVILLMVGAMLFVKAASSLSADLGVPKFTVGAIMMSLATTTPELMVSYTAVVHDQIWIAIGNIFGSYIANIGLVIGLSGLIRPIRVPYTFFQRHMPFCVAALTLLILISMKGSFYWVDAFLILLMTIPWVVWVGMDEQSDVVAVEKAAHGLWMSFSVLLVSAGMLYLGATILVSTSEAIAFYFGVTSLVMGLTIVAVSTSLPELAAGIASAYYGEFELLLGNVLGANILLILFVFPITVMLSGQHIILTNLWSEYLFMAMLTMMLWMFSAYFDRESRISRLESLMLLAVFGFYQAYTLL
ncbi:sodium:calcium antiporter [Gammaproteobacteria bacterium]|nr:sodium:calcium antiporter [Gammaproteobacteria bacterium]